MKTILSFLFLFFSFSLEAQIKRTIKGTVKDSSQLSLNGASIRLLAINAQQDTLTTMSNNSGEFKIAKVNASSFKLQVSYIGYADYTRIYHYPEADTIIDIGTILLSGQSKLLEEIIVTADRTITIKEDTIAFKADSFKTRPDADVEALLKKLPGVQVDAAGNITAYGKTVTKIRVNGKDFFSGDIKTATKELPSNIVDVVQIIDDYGDQAAFTGVKDGDPDKIINLKIKKDKNKGYFGRGQAGYGNNERYTVNGSLNHFNNDRQISALLNFNNTNSSTFSLPAIGSGGGGIGGMMRGGMPDNGTINTMTTIMNNGDAGFLQSGQVGNNGVSRTNSVGLNLRDDLDKKLSIYGSYTFTDRETVTISSANQTNIFSNGDVVNFTASNKVESNTGHRSFLNAEWKIDSFNQIKFSPSFSYNKSNSTTASNFIFNNNNNSKISEGNSNSVSDYAQPNFNTTLLYNHRFRKSGRLLSANLNAGYNRNSQEDNVTNNSNYYSPNATISNNQHQLITQEINNPSTSIRISFIEPLSRHKSLELNYTNSSSSASNDRETTLLSGSSYSRLDSLSNLFENEFTHQRYGINYRYNKKKYNYSVGLAVQSNQMTGESLINQASYSNKTINWFPTARFTYNFSRTKNLSVNYTSYITAPSASQLQPVYDYSDPQYPVIGNPELNPEFKSTLSAQYSNFNFMSGNILFSSLSFSFTKNKVVTNSVNKTGSGNGASAIQETGYLNADGYYSAFGFYNFSKPLQNRKYTLTLNGNLHYTNDISFVNSEKNRSQNFTGTQGLNLDARLQDWLELGAGGNFTYNQTRYSLTSRSNTQVTTYVLSSNGKIYFPGKLVLNFDLNKTFNSGYGVSSDPFIINSYLEKQFSKNNQLSVRLHVYDLLNKNISISRTVSANSIIDTRTNRLGQYFILSFNFRLQKFKGQQPKIQFPPMPPFLRD